MSLRLVYGELDGVHGVHGIHLLLLWTYSGCVQLLTRSYGVSGDLQYIPYIGLAISMSEASTILVLGDVLDRHMSQRAHMYVSVMVHGLGGLWWLPFGVCNIQNMETK